MLVFCHGIPKSASSYVLQVADAYARKFARDKGIRHYSLKTAFGHSDELFVSEFHDLDALVKRAKEALDRADGVVVIKLHREATPTVQALLGTPGVVALSTFRHPADVALALMDARKLDLARELDRFTKYKTIDDTIPDVEHYVSQFFSWATCKGVELFYFDDIAEREMAVHQRIASLFGYSQLDESILLQFQDKQQSVWEFNKGVANRFLTEMSPEDLKTIESRFSEFLAFISEYERRNASPSSS